MTTYTLKDSLTEDELGALVVVASSRSSRLHVALDTAMWKVRAILRLLRAYVSGSYRDVPWKTIAALSGALLYFVSPADAIPDMIPGVGYADDAIVLATVASAFAHDISRFLSWERQKGA